MKKVAIIGAGISGLTAAHSLKNRYSVKIFEKDEQPGGLIKCRRVKGSLFHTCGGHVFNSKRQDVLDWFWSFFDRDQEFSKVDRNAVVFMGNGKIIPYPIENHMYFFDSSIQKLFIDDLLKLSKERVCTPENFEDFLKYRFGKTLYEMYFKPYNEKVWRRDLKQVPLTWLEGKLPMPTVAEMIYNNINHVEEKSFVHASFWYEKQNGSQYIADKLAHNLDIVYNSDIRDLKYDNNGWHVIGELFDKIVFCGNIKDMIQMINGIDVSMYKSEIDALEYHGTTAVFCEIDNNSYSWIYQPSRNHESHRIICTGNFAKSNNAGGKMTATIEFTDKIEIEDILINLKNIPLNPQYLDHKYNKYTYPIQDAKTHDIIKKIKSDLKMYDFYFTGRFADWEYYNMDVAMGAAIDLCKAL